MKVLDEIKESGQKLRDMKWHWGDGRRHDYCIKVWARLHCKEGSQPRRGIRSYTIECTFKLPVFIHFSIRIANRWFDNSDLIIGKNTLTKWVPAIALFEYSMMFCCHANQKSHAVRV